MRLLAVAWNALVASYSNLMFQWAAALLLFSLSSTPSAHAQRWIETGVMSPEGPVCVDAESVLKVKGMTSFYWETCNKSLAGAYYTWFAVDCSTPIPRPNGSFVFWRYWTLGGYWQEDRSNEAYAIRLSRFVCSRTRPDRVFVAARLWVKNETQQPLSVYIDASRRCELAIKRVCTIYVTPGKHQLSLQLGNNGQISEGAYDYKAGEIIDCTVGLGEVQCRRMENPGDDSDIVSFGPLFPMTAWRTWRKAESGTAPPEKLGDIKGLTNNTTGAFADPIPDGAKILMSETVTITEDGGISFLDLAERLRITVDFSVQKDKKLKFLLLTDAMFQQMSAGQAPADGHVHKVDRIISGSGSESVTLEPGKYVFFFYFNEGGDVGLSYRSYYFEAASPAPTRVQTPASPAPRRAESRQERDPSSQPCDGATVTVVGRIDGVTFHQSENSYTISTRIPGCEEILISGHGRPPSNCVKGRTISAKGRLEFLLYVFELDAPTQVRCY